MPHLIPFLAVAGLLVVTPGADMALVTRNTVAGDRGAGLMTAFGIVVGVLMHGTAAVIGLSAIIATSASAFWIVKLAGAIYLIALGARTLFGAVRSKPAAVSADDSPGSTRPFAEGFITNVLNPKLAIFFLSLMPQFINEQSSAIPQIIGLSLLYSLLGGLWLTIYVGVVDRVKDSFQRPSVRKRLDLVSGTVLVALGLRLVTVSNR